MKENATHAVNSNRVIAINPPVVIVLTTMMMKVQAVVAAGMATPKVIRAPPKKVGKIAAVDIPVAARAVVILRAMIVMTTRTMAVVMVAAKMAARVADTVAGLVTPKDIHAHRKKAGRIAVVVLPAVIKAVMHAATVMNMKVIAVVVRAAVKVDGLATRKVIHVLLRKAGKIVAARRVVTKVAAIHCAVIAKTTMMTAVPVAHRAVKVAVGLVIPKAIHVLQKKVGNIGVAAHAAAVTVVAAVLQVVKVAVGTVILKGTHKQHVNAVVNTA